MTAGSLTEAISDRTRHSAKLPNRLIGNLTLNFPKNVGFSLTSSAPRVWQERFTEIPVSRPFAPRRRLSCVRVCGAIRLRQYAPDISSLAARRNPEIFDNA